MPHLVYSVRYSVASINPSLLTTTLHCLVIMTLVYNDTIYPVPFIYVLCDDAVHGSDKTQSNDGTLSRLTSATFQDAEMRAGTFEREVPNNEAAAYKKFAGCSIRPRKRDN
jgi:hypothetical protein